MKKLVAIPALFLLFLFFIPKQTSAQGTYECRWTGSQQLAFRCVENNITCDSGFEAGNECRSYANSPEDCNNAGPFTCVRINICGSLGEDCCTTGEQCETGLVCASGVCALERSKQQLGANPLCPGENSIDTAIGCIPIGNTNEFIGFILRWAIGIGGGIAFLLIVFAGLQIMTSAGNPERLQAGRELLTSAIAGLILLVFSVFILRIIGVDILKLPGFGR